MRLPDELRMPELKEFASSVAIVVSSCDAFFDAWRPFVFFFRKHWSDCPFPVFLIVNRLRVRSNIVQPIAVGPDRDWAANMEVALASIPQPYILYFQEDYFLNGPVNESSWPTISPTPSSTTPLRFASIARSQLEPSFQPLNDRFGIVPRDSDGRTRLQVTLWKKEVLQSTLRPGESAWNMEARASERTRDLLVLSYSQLHDATDSLLDVGHRSRPLDARSDCAVRTGRRRNRPSLSLDPQRRRLAPALPPGP